MIVATAPARAEADVAQFRPDFFARSQPVSAYDMVKLLPGFRVEEGDASLRGYSGAAGNVLIDGRRPIGKQETLETLLKRIPARSVARIELVRSAAGGVDMQGYALVANVVRSHTAALRGQVEAEYVDLRNGFSAPRLAGQLSYASGDRAFEMAAAAYRVIDDERGFGSRDRRLATGEAVRLVDYGQPQGETVGEVSGSYGQDLAGGAVRINGLYSDTRMFADISSKVRYPSLIEIYGTERRRTRAGEAGVQFERALGEFEKLEFLALRRSTAMQGVDRSVNAGKEDVNRTRSEASETIIRAVFRRQGDLVSLEAGLEAALNVLDSQSALEKEGVAVPLPSANVKVEERRGEAFATATWRPGTSLRIETGARIETSSLVQSGDSELTKSLSYFKPRLLVSWAPSPGNEFRLLVEREVGQLKFSDFASSLSLTTGNVTVGNKDLEPDTLLRTEVAWERRFGVSSLVVSARHEAIGDVVDRIPVFAQGGVYDAVGNIGHGRRGEIEADLKFPLDGLGLKGMAVQASALVRRSEVTDPTTGERRRISEDAPFEGSLQFTHDLPDLRLRWGSNLVAGSQEQKYKINEIQTDRLADRLDVYVDYKLSPTWALRFFAKNLTDSPATRTRVVYDGLRGSAGVAYVERRELRSGPYWGIRIQRNFGDGRGRSRR